MDWKQYQFGGDGVEVIFAPRAKFNGRSALPELLAAAGAHLFVRPLWLMGVDDPYPGEWALGHADRSSNNLLGRSWIASGDVSEPPNVAVSGERSESD